MDQLLVSVRRRRGRQAITIFLNSTIASSVASIIDKSELLPLKSFQVSVEAEAEVVSGPLEVADLVVHAARQRHVLALRCRLVLRC